MTTTFEDIAEYFSDPEYTTRGMSGVQMENFIFAQQISSHRVAIQFINELYTRYNAIEGHKLDRETKLAEIIICEERRDAAKTKGTKQLAIVDIKMKHHELRMLDTRMRQSRHDIDKIVVSLNKYEENIGKSLFEVDLDNEVAEREYWVKRLSKQAGLDIATTGAISFGNMESLISLPELERDSIISNAMSISHSIRSDVNEIEQQLLADSTSADRVKKRNYILGNKMEPSINRITEK
jgi:hypothetical protein